MRALILLCAALALSAGEPTWADAQAALAAGETARAQALVRAWSAGSPVQRVQAALVGARLAVLGGQPRATVAAALLPSLPPVAEVSAFDPLLQEDVAAWWQAASRADLVDQLIARQQTAVDAVRRSLAALLAGRQAMATGDWGAALHAARTGRDWLNAQSYADVAGPHWTGALDRLAADAERMDDLVRHGLGFRLYREAQEARLWRRDWAGAQALYERLIAAEAANRGQPVPVLTGPDDPAIATLPVAPVYAAAAVVYRAECLLNRNRLAEAATALDAAAAVETPFTGEALRLRAEVALEQGDGATALAGLERCLAWLDMHAYGAGIPAIYAVPEASRERVRPPASGRSQDLMGLPQWRDPEPSQVFAPGSVPWYGTRLRYLCLARRSLCRFLAGDQAGAQHDVNAMRDLDPDDRAVKARGYATNGSRLADGYREGGLYASDLELAEFTGKRRTEMLAADHWLCLERWREALDAYRRMAERYAGRLRPGERAYLDFASLVAEIRLGLPDDQAQTRLVAFEKEHPRTVTLARVRLLLVDYIDSDEWQRRVEVLGTVVRDFPATPFAPEAAVWQVLFTMNRDPALCRRLCADVIRRWPDDSAAYSARCALATLDQNSATKAASP